MDKKEQALEKIRKLLALAEDSAASEGEIENALKAAQNLMAKYDLDMSEVELSASDITSEEQEQDLQNNERKGWLWDMLEIIARSQNCSTIERKKLVEWNLVTYYEVYGTALEIKVTKNIFKATVPIVRNLAKKRHREKSNSVIQEQLLFRLPINPPNQGKFFNDYVDGFLHGLNLKLSQNKKDNIIEDKTGKYGLIVIRKDELVQSYIKICNPLLKEQGSRKEREIDFETWLLGEKDGSSQHDKLLE